MDLSTAIRKCRQMGDIKKKQKRQKMVQYETVELVTILSRYNTI